MSGSPQHGSPRILCHFTPGCGFLRLECSLDGICWVVS